MLAGQRQILLAVMAGQGQNLPVVMARKGRLCLLLLVCGSWWSRGLRSPPASTNYDIPVYNTTSTISYIEGGSTNVSKAEFSQFTNLDLRKDVDKEKAMDRVNSRKVVEAQLAILRSYIAKPRPPSDNCEGRGIYVYALPPKFNKDLVAKCNEIMPWLDFCKYFENDAMGEPILELGNGWYNTHQFSLEPIFHRRILRHPCRVEKAEEAKLFYVPFYGA
uniref:Exostosin GT47 domain-containing protein n=1 Tax=Chenopodium quinoa TaxID=63459 RepID=A0A803LRB0_CHEQI